MEEAGKYTLVRRKIDRNKKDTDIGLINKDIIESYKYIPYVQESRQNNYHVKKYAKLNF